VRLTVAVLVLVVVLVLFNLPALQNLAPRSAAPSSSSTSGSSPAPARVVGGGSSGAFAP